MKHRPLFWLLALIIICLIVVLFISEQASSLALQQNEPIGIDVINPADATATAYTQAFITPVPDLSEEAKIALTYISSKYHIDVNTLVISNEQASYYEHLQRELHYLGIYNSVGSESFLLLVDSETGEVIEDIEAIEDVAQSAANTRYGKLSPLLYQELQSMEMEGILKVSIWAFVPYSIEQRVFERLASKYPEVRLAIQSGGAPMDVADMELSRTIRRDYIDFIYDENNLAAIQLLDLLEKSGITYERVAGIPAVEANLTKEQIQLLSQESVIGVIHLVESQSIQLEIVPTPHTSTE